MVVATAACGPPLRWMKLDPPALTAGEISATVAEMAVTEDILEEGFYPEGVSRAVVQVWLNNSSGRPRVLRLAGAQFELRELAGTGVFGSYPGRADIGSGRAAPAGLIYVLAPGENLKVSLTFAYFPWHVSDRPLKVLLRVPVDDAPPLEVKLADLGDARAPLWRARRGHGLWRNSWRTIGGKVQANMFGVFGMGLYWPRQHWYVGSALGLGFVTAPALRAGSPGVTTDLSLEGGFFPYQWNWGIYAAADYLVAYWYGPYRDRYLRGQGWRSFPNLSVGLAI
ncbi:MAG TPA: hypothetical protein VFH68_01435, partial [Polyangia bacterium]|nr:hypothetical protein [Polyangia bacterium]